MNRSLTTGSFVLLLLLVLASPLLAKGTAGVSNTIHNLSTSAPIDPFMSVAIYGTNEDEVCIFCHTPHGGSLTGPLWNKNNPTSTWTHYNSATLSTYLKGLSVNRAIGDESMLCMSCHDGSISVNHLLNTSNDIGTPENTSGLYSLDPTDVKIVAGFDGKPFSKIGGAYGAPDNLGDLSDDHPISFSYDQVLLSAEYNGGAKSGQLNPVATATSWAGEGIRFFGAGNRVECSTCHDPHVDYQSQTAYAPFLIMPNTGSNMCLACHVK